jgi:hypothetical protein
MKTSRILVLIFSMFSLVANSQSHAAQLILPAAPSGDADLFGAPLDVTYNSTSQSFQISGELSGYSGGTGGPLFEYGYVFDLMATINSAGMLTGGTLNIMGDIGSGDETLLAGNLVSGLSGTAWGYDNNNNIDKFSFLFTVASGSDATVASDFGGIGGVGGINLYADFSGNNSHDTPFTGTWGASFDNLFNGQANWGQGYANVFPVSAVPEPSSMLLVLAGVLSMVARRRLSAPRA